MQDILECAFDFSHEDLDGVELVDKELKKEKIDDKMGILDIHIRLKDRTHVDLEMQQLWIEEFVSRSIFYVAKMYVEDFVCGSSYSHLHKCVSANVIAEGFNLSKKIHSVFVLQEEETSEALGDFIKFHFFNLEKIKDLPISDEDTKESRLINWLKFINADEKEERDMLATTSPVLRILNEKMNTLTLTKEEKKLYDSRMKLKSDIATIYESRFNAGIEKGREEGREEGSHAKAVETARNCLALNMPIDIIAKITALSKEEIKILQV